MKYHKFLILILPILFFFGCASTQVKPVNFKNYGIDSLKKVNIGDKMVINRDGYQYETKEWVGLFNSPDGWRYRKYLSDDSFQEELIYTGRINDEIHISYREYKKDFARPAFFQDLVYDLRRSKMVVFKQYKLEIEDATNEFILFKVLTD